VAGSALKVGGKELKMVLALGYYDRRASFCERRSDVIQDQTVATPSHRPMRTGQLPVGVRRVRLFLESWPGLCQASPDNTQLESYSRLAREEASTATVGSVSFVLLIAVVANGCANQSFNEGRRRVTGSELMEVQAEPRTSSRSDRLRGGLAQASPPLQAPERSRPAPDTPTPARPPEPAPQDRTQPQPPRPPEAAPPRATEEPDPRAIIDWLLKERR
jgi:hypothetical protein